MREIALTTTSRGDRASPDAVAHTEIRDQLATTARMVLAEIDAAVLRMDNSQYGKCDRCGDPLEIQRLRIHPQTRYCLRCHYAMDTTMNGLPSRCRSGIFMAQNMLAALRAQLRRELEFRREQLEAADGLRSVYSLGSAINGCWPPWS